MIPCIKHISTVLAVSLVLALGSGAAARAAENVSTEEWDIIADKLTRYDNLHTIIAEGDVVLRKVASRTTVRKKRGNAWSDLLGEEGQAAEKDADAETVLVEKETITTIQADWLVYDQNLGTVKARGNIRIQVGPDLLTADEGTIDLNRETGVFHNAVVIRSQKALHLEGRVIRKTGTVTYEIEDGWIITCKLKDGETPPWSFASREAEITDGGYAYLHGATFRIRGVPVLYTPWMMLPAKRQRQSGLLLPAAGYSDRDGLVYTQPLFLDLAPNLDMTLYAEYLSERGFKPGVEFRYIFNGGNKGALMANYLSDDLTDPAETEYYRDGNYTHTNTDRYWVRGKADYGLGQGWTTRVDLDIVSDRDYLTEFTSGLTGFDVSQRRFLEMFGRGFQDKTADERTNSLNVLKSWNVSSFQAQLLGINDTRYDKSGDSPLWKLPQLLYTGYLPVGNSPVDFSWDTGFVYYWREDGVGGQRFDIRPEFSMPLPLGDYLEATASLALRDTAYLIQTYGDGVWEDSDTKNRFLVDFNTEVGTTLQRDFALSLGSATGLSHQFRPYVSYGYIPDVDQDDLPYFDGTDRIHERNSINYGLDNFFNLRSLTGGTASEREYAYLKIEHGYDLRSDMSDTPWLPVYVKLGMKPMNDLGLIYRTHIDLYGAGVTDYSLEALYQSDRGDYLNADYRYDKFTDIHSVKASAYVNLFWSLAAGYSIERSFMDSKTISEQARLIYQPACWSVEFATDYVPGERKFMVIFSLANLGSPMRLDL